MNESMQAACLATPVDAPKGTLAHAVATADDTARTAEAIKAQFSTATSNPSVPVGPAPMSDADVGRVVEACQKDPEVMALLERARTTAMHPAATTESALQIDKPLEPLDRSDTVSAVKAGPAATCGPGPGVVSFLKTPCFKGLPKGDRAYHAEHFQNVSGARVVRYWDRDVAHLDLITFEAGANPDTKAWTLGDGFDRCWLAHVAVMQRSSDGWVPPFNYIHHLEVRENCRRGRLGTELMRFVLTEILGTSRTPSIWLCANSSTWDDKALRRFYERLGFRRLAPGVAMMYWDWDYCRRVLVDPEEKAINVPYVPR